MWAKCAEGLSVLNCTGSPVAYNWQQALDAAQSSTLAGHDDWRLPNFKELLSIVEEQCHDPAINNVVFPYTPSSYFWSASPFSGNSTYAWFVNFSNGYAYFTNRSISMFVRLVRSGQ